MYFCSLYFGIPVILYSCNLFFSALLKIIFMEEIDKGGAGNIEGNVEDELRFIAL